MKWYKRKAKKKERKKRKKLKMLSESGMFTPLRTCRAQRWGTRRRGQLVGASAGPSVSGGEQRTNRTPASRADTWRYLAIASRALQEDSTNDDDDASSSRWIAATASDDLRAKKRISIPFFLRFFFLARGKCIPAGDRRRKRTTTGMERR